MKIAVLSDSLTIPTGYKNQMSQLVQYLRSKGHEIFYMANGYVGADMEGLKLDGGEQYDFKIYGHNTINPYFKETMSKIIRDNKVDRFIVLLDTFMLYPWFLNIDTSPAKTFFWFPSDGGGGLPKGCDSILRKIDTPVAMAKFGQKQVKDYHNLNVEHIPHGLNTEEFKPVSEEKK